MRTASPSAPPAANDPCWCGSGQKYKKCHQPRDLLRMLQHGEARSAMPPPQGFRRVLPGRVSAPRTVPAHIPRPDYAATGKPKGSRQHGLIKGPDQILRMRRACRAAREILEEAKQAVAPGVTTDAIDRIVHDATIARGGYPSPLNYHGFPKSVCTSVNEVICHGIPDDRPLERGDIVNIDVTIFVDGMHGDCNETVIVGDADPESRKLLEVTRSAMFAGIGAVRPGGRIRDVGRAIEAHVAALSTGSGYGVVRAFVGHGIGELFHMDPQVPHYFDAAAQFLLEPGMTFTVEPMINQGTWRHVSWDDGWTAVTADLKRSAQFEHTILVTPNGVEILTLPEGVAQPFAH